MDAAFLTVGLNSARDVIAVVPRFTAGAVHHPRQVVEVAGGKANNAARALAALGAAVTATGFLAGWTGTFVEHDLTAWAVSPDFVRGPGETRTCYSIVDPEFGPATGIYPLGPEVGEAEVEALLAHYRRLLTTRPVIVISGSLPPGAPVHLYRTLVEMARSAGSQVLLDTSGPGLRAALPARPAMVKINRAEAAETLERAVTSERDARDAAARLLSLGAGFVLITAASETAVAGAGDERWVARPPEVALRSEVGAGDATAAGLAFASSNPAATGSERVRFALAAGAAACEELVPGLLQTAALQRYLPRVEIHRVS